MSRLFNQMLIMRDRRGIRDCAKSKSVGTERVELLLSEVDAFLDEVLAILKRRG